MKSNNNETTPSLDRLAIAASQRVKERDYWLKKLSGEWSKTGYPYDYNKKTGSETARARYSFQFSSQLSTLLLRLSKGSDIRLHMILTAGLAVLLYRFLETGIPADKDRDENLPGSDIIIGSPISKSGAAADYINTVLVLRNFVTPLMTFKELLVNVQQTTAEAVENKNYPVEILAQQLNRPISPGSDFPLFDIALLVENIHDKKYLSHININMIISLERLGESISGAVEYNTSLYKSSTIERMIGYWMCVLTGGLSHIDTPVCSLDILSQQEKQQLLIDFNAEATGYPKNKTIQGLFSQQVIKTPNHLAVVDKGDAASGVGETRSLTYRQLEEQANRLASTLISRGVSPNQLVGIIAEPSWEMIVGILAILMTGSGYVPLNPRSPWTRNRYLLEDCRVKVLLAAAKTLTQTDFHGETICIDTGEKENTGPANGAARVTSSSEEKPADAIAYVIFTSGSTGVPKGVPVTHANFSPLVHWGKECLGLGQQDRVLQNLSYYFDWSVWEIFITLTTGAALYTAPLRILSDPASQADFIDKNQITTLHITPTQYSYLADLQRPLESLSYLFIGAEKLTYDLVQRSFSLVGKHCRVFNMYGPTEATIISAVLEISRDRYEEYKDLSSVPIGKPVGNETLLVLDKYFNLCPLRVPGELYIGGDNVVYGYLNNPELTAEKFIFNRSYKSYRTYIKLYKTGDLARWLPEGSIEFLGRQDFQVKIRGFRIELGEIENQLLSHKQIKEAVVTARQEGNSEEYYLTAYVVANGPLSEPDLRGYLSQRLPDYMVPAHLIFLDRLPLTPNGKLDRKALPEPDVQAGKEYIAPRDEIENRLAGIWSGILGIDKNKISIEADFFQLGGHSLRATTLVYQVYKEFQVNMEIEDVFVHPTIREMAQRLRGMEGLAYQEICPREEREYYEISYAQRRLWILCQFEEDSTAYNIPGAVMLSGTVCKEVLGHALQEMANRHESLRTIFISINGDPFQRIIKDFIFSVEEIDLRSLDNETREEKAREIYTQHANQAFKLEKGPLFQYKLIRLQEESYLLMSNVHHIISDGWSQGIIHSEILEFYNAFIKGTGIDLPALKLQYKDYTYWHNRLIGQGSFNVSRQYWSEKFKDRPNGIELPLDHTRQPIQTFNGGKVVFIIDKQRTSQLHRLSLEQDATLFMSLLTLVEIFLYRYTGQTDMIIGAPIANRKHPELQSMIGFLVNTLIYRNPLNPEESFNQTLAKIKPEALECYKYQDYPFDLLVEQLGLDRDLSQSPLFNVMLAHNNTEAGERQVEMEGAAISQYAHSDEYNMSKFDLIFFMDETTDRVYTRIEYNSDLFERSTVQRMADNFLTLVDSVIDSADRPIRALDLLSPDQYKQVIYQFNETASDFGPLTLPELFEQQVAKSGEKTAVVYEGNRVTYAELDKKINRLAHYLRRKYRIKPNDVIGVSMDRSLEMIVVLSGIIKAGAAYLALDPTYPRERVLHVLENSQSDLLIIDKMRPGLFGDYRGEILNIHEQEEEIQRQPDQAPALVNQPTDILYVNYTSGSTGTPNGAMLSHDCLTNLIQWQNQETSIDCSLRCLQFTSINFCVSFQEIMGTLTSGGELYLIGDMERQDIDYLMDFLSKNRIEVLFLPFSYLNFLFNETSRWHQAFDHNLKHIITAGEQLKITVGLQRFLDKNPGIKLHNHYGSTEMHVVTSYTLDAATASQTPIPPAGKPISNVSIYILDEHLNPVPVGVWGELFVAGSSQVLGYINNTALNQQKLVHHSWLSGLHDNQRLYRSGDIGRWQPDGNIELRGRKDFQVKIRGFRVELGEIESKILAIENIRECVVVVKEDKSRQKFLLAYICAEGIDMLEIKKKLSAGLPQYMVPKILLLDHLPLMPNGKVDRERLPEPGMEIQASYTAPRDELEKQLAKIWKEILELESDVIDIDTDFFEMGGHSLKATALVSRLHKEFQVKVPLLEVFQSSTIRELARRVKSMKTEVYKSIRVLEQKEFYPAAYNQQRLWLLNQDNPRSATFNMAGVIALDFDVDIHLVKKVLNRLTRRHESFRTGFKVISDRLVQVIKKEMEIPFKMEDLSSLQQPGKENKKQEIYSRELEAPFDLQQMPLFRAALLKLAERKYELLFNMHHLISDGWSIEILKHEFNTLYDAYKKGSPEDIDMQPLEIQYKDYAGWQNQLLANEEKMAEVKEFWKNYLASPLPVLNLPYDFTHYSGRTASSAYRWVVPESLANRLRKLAIDHHASLFMVLLAGFDTLLSQVTAQEDIILAIPAAARQHEALKNIVGLFVNTLILRSKINGEETFMDFFKHFQDNAFKILDHQDIPLELIFSQLKIKYPTISVFFNMVNIGSTHLQTLSHLESRHAEKVQDAKFDMVCYVTEYKNGIEINCHYFKDRFKPRSIEKLMDFYKKTLESIGDDPGKKLKEYRFTTKKKTLKRNN